MDSMNRRVVISGMGVLSSAGANLAQARNQFISGECCLFPLEDHRLAHVKVRFAGLLQDFPPPSLEAHPAWQRADRHVHMALVAARETLASARVQPAALGRRMGLIFATCSGPMLRIEEHYERIIRGDPRITKQELFAKKYYAGAWLLARVLGIQGFAATVVTACTASTGAIGLATDLIRCGLLDAALAGGSDAFSTSTLAGFDGLKATTDGKCAPFSKPFGLNLGEAAGFLFLETLDSAQRRGVPVQAEILGSGTSNDAYHCSAPDPFGRGLATAINRALHNAGLTPSQIAYINAHGTGTEANDKAETRAIRKVFGQQADTVPVSSTKGLVGHCLGAAGVVEIIASLVCAEAGVYPPTTGFSEAREGCSLDYVPEGRRSWQRPRIFLSNNAAFGGHNASLAVCPAEDSPGPAPTQHPGQTIGLTGCGLVSSLGLGIPALLDALQAGQSGIQPVDLPGLPALRVGLVDEEAVEKLDRRLDLRTLDRSSRWATVATRLAMRQAGYPENAAALAELGLFLHLSTGPSWAESEFLTSFLSHDRQVNQLMAFPYIVPCSVTGNVCRTLRLTGHNLTLSLGPGAGLWGLWPAMAALRNGHAQAMLTGAVDELSERILQDHGHAGLITPSATPPGEGSAVFLLETEQSAKARGVSWLATVAGMAVSFAGEGSDSVEPTIQTLARLVDEALAQAGISPA
jgi:3-oxoacyl-[acyl-carrier-protein] synthase II